jgi:hypothetical protein
MVKASGDENLINMMAKSLETVIGMASIVQNKNL